MDKGTGKQAQEFAKLIGGFRASRVVLTANTLRVFEPVGKGATATVLAMELSADPRALEINMRTDSGGWVLS